MRAVPLSIQIRGFQVTGLINPLSVVSKRRQACIFLVGAFLLSLPVDPSRSSRASSDIIEKIERIGPEGGEVRSLLIDRENPQIVFLGSSDGLLFKSLDGGRSWSPINPGIARPRFVIDTLVQHPVDPRHLFAGAWDLDSAGGGLFESFDSGVSWKELKLPHISPAVRDLAVSKNHPSRIMLGALDTAYLSDDGGATWNLLGANAADLQKIESVAMDPIDPRILYIGTWRLPYRTSDSGRTWQRIQTGMLIDSDIFSICPDPKNEGVIYASACTGIYRSDNRGSSWTRLKVLPTSYGVRAHFVYVDPTDSNRIFGGTTEGLFISDDAGQSWRRSTSANLTVNAIQVDPRNGRRILMGSESEGVLRSEDGGKSWTPSNSGFIHRQVSRIMADGQVPGRIYVKMLADGPGSSLLAYDKSEKVWKPKPVNFPAMTRIYSCLALPHARGLLLGTSQGVYHQDPAASGSWRKLIGAVGRLAVYDLVLDARGSRILAGTSEGIYHARLDSMAFQRPAQTRLFPIVSSIQISRQNPAILYAASSLGVIRSVDHGYSWTVASSGLPLRASVASLAISPADNDHIFAGTSLGLFETKDGAKSWQRANDGRLSVDVPSVIVLDDRGDQILAADNSLGGVFFSSDGGKRWNKSLEPYLSSPVSSLAQDPASPFDVYIGTHSDGVYRLRLNTILNAPGSRGSCRRRRDCLGCK